MLGASVLALTAGCSPSTTTENPEATAVARTPTGNQTALPSQAPPEATGHHDEDADLAPLGPAPTWDTRSQQAAIAAATAAMRAFARPQLSAAAWWKDLAPMLSPTAAAAYQGTDPQNVPVHAITGTARLAPASASGSGSGSGSGSPESTPYLARVQVPTDVGICTVLLSRTDQAAPWLMERITLPVGTSS
jgi:hypothetical protein